MSKVVKLPIKERSQQDPHRVATWEVHILALESLRRNWGSIVGDLRQMEGDLAVCRQALEGVEESLEKEKSLKQLALAEIIIRDKLSKCLAITMALQHEDPGSGSLNG